MSVSREVRNLHGINVNSLELFEKIFSIYNVVCDRIHRVELENIKKDVLLSICIPTRNRANYVYEFVTECLKIKSDEIEIIVLDNGSRDNTKPLLSKIWDKRFIYYRNDKPTKEFIHIGDCLNKANGKFSLLLQDVDFIPDIDQWFENIKPLLENSDDTTIYMGNVKNSNGKLFVNMPKSVFKKDTAETYNYVLNCSTIASAIIFPQKIVRQHFEEIKKDVPYFTSIYPHLSIMFYCVKFCDIAPLDSLVVQIRGNAKDFSLEVNKALPTMSDENWKYLKSKQILALDAGSFVKSLNVSDDVRLSILENVIVKQCDWITEAFVFAYRNSDEVAMAYQKRGYTYWHYEFWSSFFRLMEEFKTSYGIKEIKLDLLEKVFNRYEKLCKMIDNKKSELEKSEEVKK